MVPLGATGVRETPAREAVKVTDVLITLGPAGDGVRVIEGVAAFTVTLVVPVLMA
jgi:hypothetical protein